ncbi:GYD domain protein [Planctomycetes bacterium Pan216]|uniref:GYD domain protein n=1 Tax=Kolteria novifilia TaxID=2527975 RepID=A0A518B8H8_9BACT|nr:GYD domain protein [Planctomycetes bacterium Pan216]
MPKYVCLLTFAEQGEEELKNTPGRVEDLCNIASDLGAKVDQIYWCMGAYDGVILFEAANDATASALILRLDAIGNVRGETLRAFDTDEMVKIVDMAFR